MALRQVEAEDVADALDHVSDFDADVTSFSETKPALLPLRDLYRYDDVSSWAEWQRGELLELDPDEREEELKAFRGKNWAKLACTWRTPSDMPPIVIVTGPSFSGVGDGRGRVSYAIGMNWSAIPAVFVRLRK